MKANVNFFLVFFLTRVNAFASYCLCTIMCDNDSAGTYLSHILSVPAAFIICSLTAQRVVVSGSPSLHELSLSTFAKCRLDANTAYSIILLPPLPLGASLRSSTFAATFSGDSNDWRRYRSSMGFPFQLPRNRCHHHHHYDFHRCLWGIRH